MNSIDHRKLKAFRKRLRLSLGQAAELSEIPKSCIDDYENARANPPLPRLRKLCVIYSLDFLEILELLRLIPIPRDDLHRFRAACRKEGTTPATALHEFIMVFSDDVNNPDPP